VLDALERLLSGAARDNPPSRERERRPWRDFSPGERDLTHESPDAPLPESVASGAEPLLVIGAMAGG
jgi:hypothetical protein